MKKNGFVFIETIVVVTILSVILLVLYGSYSYILRKSNNKKSYDTTDSIYATYYVKEYINKSVGDSSFVSFFDNNCTKYEGSTTIYVCDNHDAFKSLNLGLDVDKIYFLSPYSMNTLDNDEKIEFYNYLDLTTIEYVRSLGKSAGRDENNNIYNILIVKYKHTLSDGTYEIVHANMEV